MRQISHLLIFVADMRAPTPSAAAELAVTEAVAVENRIYEYERRLKAADDVFIICKKRLSGKIKA